MLSILLGVLVTCQLQAQQQQGRVVYEFTRQTQIRIGGPDGEGQPMARTHVIKLEVLFANNQMLQQQLPDDNIADMAEDQGGVHIRMMGDDEITWLNFGDQRKVEQRDFAGKQYLVSDSIRKLNWKLTGETRTILGYACQQATTTNIGKRRMMKMDGGDVRAEEVPDTSTVVVWFTPSIPVPAGPDFQGQLPGLILEIDVNGSVQYKALEVSAKGDLASIKEPKKGKKVTAAEFVVERDKMVKEMQKRGGMRIGG